MGQHGTVLSHVVLSYAKLCRAVLYCGCPGLLQQQSRVACVALHHVPSVAKLRACVNKLTGLQENIACIVYLVPSLCRLNISTGSAPIRNMGFELSEIWLWPHHDGLNYPCEVFIWPHLQCVTCTCRIFTKRQELSSAVVENLVPSDAAENIDPAGNGKSSLNQIMLQLEENLKEEQRFNCTMLFTVFKYRLNPVQVGCHSVTKLVSRMTVCKLCVCTE